MTDRNRTILQCFEWYLADDGTFWNQVKALAPSFHFLGLTDIWLPPAYKGAAGIHDVGYGVYDMYDLGEFDQKGAVRTKYGTRQQYLAAVAALHQQGEAVIADVVFNHRMGADGTELVSAVQDNAADREQDISDQKTIKSWTSFTFPGRHGKYSAFTWNHNDFDGTDWDESGRQAAIYRFSNKQWDQDVDAENGNYDYLMGCDLDMSSPRVIKELSNWGKWYLDTVPIDGVRLDAVKHIRFTFFEKWLAEMDAYAKKKLFAVGEYWNGDVGCLLHYLDVNANCLSLFDVPLHYRFLEAANSGGGYDMRSLFDQTLVQQRPQNAVAFVDNHDTQPGQALQSFVPAWFKPLAYAAILLRQAGIPCVFYGDLYGIPHDQIAPVADLKKMIRLRQAYAYGSQIDYLDDGDLLGWTRSGDPAYADSGMAVLISDGPGGQKQMHVDASCAGRHFVDALQHQPQEVVLDQQGDGLFTVDGGSVSVWVDQAAAAAVTAVKDS